MAARFLVLNDIHIADKPPLGRTDGFTDQIFAKLEACRNIAATCDYTIMSGDLFHIKRANHVSHRLVQRLIFLFDGWPCPIWAIVGNHDLSEEGIGSISKQPIGVLFESGVISWLSEDTLLPVDGLQVQLSPANYVDNIDQDPKFYALNRNQKADLAIKVAHGSLVPPGTHLPFETTSMATVDTTGMDICLFGHLHWDTGIHRVNDCVFASFGSLARVSRHDIDRIPRVLVVSVSKADIAAGLPEHCFEEHILDVTPSAEAFLPVMDSPIVEVSDSLKSYAAQLATSIRMDEDMSLDELFATVGTKVPANIQKRVRSYLLTAGF